MTKNGVTDWYTRFNYDAGEQHTYTAVKLDNTHLNITYYPFPLYEEEVEQEYRPPHQCIGLEGSGESEGEGLVPDPGWCWVTTQVTRRTVYTLAGRAIATRVTTNPPQPTDGLFYFITDHLSSTRLLAAPNSSPVPGTTAHYLPYGDYRGNAPTATPLTERGYTGHHENREIGLTYMNARFYSPTSGRFLTADTIVPDAADPQAHNRYTYSLGNPIVLFDSTGHCAEAFTGALREDNLQGNDGACWSMYYNWLDQGYLGLDPSWDYLRVDIWLIEELYLQLGVSFASIWVYQWSADAIELDAAASLRCYGLNCSVSYQRLTIEASDGYYTLLMDGVPAWLFQSFYTALDGLGRDVMRPIRGIGTDPNSHLREAMQAYGTAYTNYWNAFEDVLIASGATFVSTIAIFSPISPLALVGLAFSTWGLYRSINTMNTSWDAQVSNLATINQSIYALQVRIYD